MSNPQATVYSADNYLSALQALLPTGRVWPRDVDAVLSKALSGLTPVYERNNQSAAGLIPDGFPASTYYLLPEWESSLGLPDPCAGPAPTIPQRQAAVLARFVSVAGDSVAWYTQYAANLGYTITVRSFSPFRMGFSGMGDAVGGEEWFFVWEVVCAALDTMLECEMQALNPAHLTLIFSTS
jgi:uncharacterized protein YmfQ (DUF2313 family)